MCIRDWSSVVCFCELKTAYDVRIGDWSSVVCSSDLRAGEEFDLPGPVGERNLYALRPRGRIALQASTPSGLRIQLGAVLATGNSAVVSAEAVSTGLLGLPDTELAKIAQVENEMSTEDKIGREA